MLQVIKEGVISNYHYSTNKVLLGRETHDYFPSVGPDSIIMSQWKIPQYDNVTTHSPNQLILIILNP